MSLHTLVGYLLGGIVLAVGCVSGCGKRCVSNRDSAGDRDVAGALRDAAAKSKRLTVSIAAPGQRFMPVSTTVNRVVIVEVAKAIRVKPGEHGFGYSGEFQLEFWDGDEQVTLDVYYSSRHLGSSLWRGQYDMTDEGGEFLRGFLLGAGLVVLEMNDGEPLEAQRPVQTRKAAEASIEGGSRQPESVQGRTPTSEEGNEDED